MKKLAFVLSLVVLGWATTASVQAREVTLHYNYLPGESRTYGLGVAGTGTAFLAGIPAPLEFSVTSAMTQNCKQVTEDGAMEIETVSSPASVSVSFAGSPVEVSDLPTEETRMSFLLYPDGQMKFPDTPKVATDGPLGVLGLQMDPYQVAKAAAATTLPQEAVSEGSQWSRAVEVPLPGGKSGQLTAVSTLSGFQQTQGIDCAVIDTEFSLPFSLQFPGLGVSLDGWATGKVREVATVEQMKTVEQTGNISMSLKSTPLEEEGSDTLLGPGLLSSIELTISAAFNLHLQESVPTPLPAPSP